MYKHSKGVREVAAYTTSDGKIFLNEVDALKYEARETFKKLGLDDVAMRILLANASEVADVLDCYARSMVTPAEQSPAAGDLS